METQVKGIINPTDGTVTLDIYNWLESLDQDALNGMRDILGALAYDELHHMLQTSYATDTFGSNIQKLRIAFLTDDEANPMFRQCIKGLLDDLYHEQTQRKRYRNAYWGLWLQLNNQEKRNNIPEAFDSPSIVTEADVDAAIEKYTENFPRETK